MIAMEPIIEVIGLALWTAYLQGERPLSLVLGAPVESGKTEAVRMFSTNGGILYINDFTPTGFIREYTKEIRAGHIKHILVPDLLTPLSKQYYSQQSLIAFLNGLTEEGIARIHTMFAHFTIKSPVAIGIIGGITKERLGEKRKQWAKVGFLSRMLPVTWSYGDATINLIMRYIMTAAYRKEKPLLCTFPDTAQEVTIPTPLAKMLTPLIGPLIGAEKTYGFRYQRHFQRLAMASALQDNRDAVNIDDIDRVIRLSKFCNLEFNEL